MTKIKSILLAAYLANSMSVLIASAALDPSSADDVDMSAIDYIDIRENILDDLKELTYLKTSASREDKAVSDWIEKSQDHVGKATCLLSKGELDTKQQRFLELFILSANHAKAVIEHEITLTSLPIEEQKTFSKKRPSAWKDFYGLSLKIIETDLKSPKCKSLFEKVNSTIYEHQLLQTKLVEIDDVKEFDNTRKACETFLINEVIPAQVALETFLKRDDLTGEEAVDCNFFNAFLEECGVLGMNAVSH